CSANTEDALVATYADPAKGATCYLYGPSDAGGRGTTVKSMVYRTDNSDTLVNVVLDGQMRPALVYLSRKDGYRFGQLATLQYTEKDSVKVSYYTYDWTTQKDSLLAQYTTIDGKNGTVLYGAKVSSTDAWFTLATVGLVAVGVLCPVAAGLIVGVGLNGGPLLAALATLGTASIAWADQGKTASLSTQYPKPIPSPTATAQAVPQPKGSPASPGGTIDLSGIWTLDLSLGTSNCDETLLEDEAGIPPTLHFTADGKVIFDTDPVDSDLNGPSFTNIYDLNGTSLKIASSYKDGTDNIHFQCNLSYDSNTKKFAGTYTNQWTDGSICTNNVVLYR
ncbi:MAG: hypothetical protein JNL13_00015, partial [Chitinophagaceae bacterium]|nr:hypothetical protein [Chitinophagaceae bacterium]